MRIGSLVYATNQGLGILAKSFYDHGIITHPIIVKHNVHDNHYDWYPSGTPRVNLPLTPHDASLAALYLVTMDAVLFFETPFHWPLIEQCRASGVRTALMPMYECMPERLPHCPDLMMCPSLLDLDYYPNSRWTCGTTKSVFTPVPVEVPWRQRTRANVFIHNAGNGSYRDRNGTGAILESIQYMKSRARIVIRTQRAMGKAITPRLEVRNGTVPYDKLWDEGDVFLFPERFNGLSLPLQEARAAGMLVMAADRYPMNTWLPRTVACVSDPAYPSDTRPILIPVSSEVRARIGAPYQEFDEAVIDPKDIAAKVDEWYGRDITAYSESARVWAEENSWTVLGPKYKDLLESTISG